MKAKIDIKKVPLVKGFMMQFQAILDSRKFRSITIFYPATCKTEALRILKRKLLPNFPNTSQVILSCDSLPTMILNKRRRNI